MKKIYVGNLSYDVDEQSLEEEFARFGNIEKTIIIKDRVTGRSKGFGFIEYATDSSAQSALTMDGQQFRTRALKVSLAREREKSAKTGGGFSQRRRDSHREGHRD